MINRNISVAAIVVGLGVAGHAMSATVVRIAPKAAESYIVFDSGRKGVRPLYSSLCEYKAVMNHQDMVRCGVFVGEPGPRFSLASYHPVSNPHGINYTVIVQPDSRSAPRTMAVGMRNPDAQRGTQLVKMRQARRDRN